MNEPSSLQPTYPQATPLYPAVPPTITHAYTPFDAVISLLLIVLCALFVRMARSGGGIGTSVFFLGIIVVFTVSLYKSGKRMNAGQWGLLTALAVLSVTFSLFSLNVLSVCTVLFLGGFGSLWLYSSFTGQKLFHRFWLWDMGYSLILPFKAFGSLFGAFKSLPKGKNRAALNVLIGLGVAVPLTVVVAALLQSADAAFAGVFADLFKLIPDNFFEILIDTVAGLPLALYLHGMLIAAREHTPAPDRQQQRCDWLAARRIAPRATLYSATTPVLVIYALFLAVQSGYFFSAFSGLIPDGMTYSDCARRGFFELCAVAALNLIIIGAMWWLCRYENQPPQSLRVYGMLFSFSTLLLIAVAISKMMLYMQFGLTVLRVYTTWFMLLLAILFVLIALRMLLPRLPLMKLAGVVAFALCFVLFVSNVNGMIATYNTRAYQSGQIEMELDYLETLGDAAIPSIKSLAADDDKQLARQAQTCLNDYLFEQSVAKQNSLQYALNWTLERQLANNATTL